MTPKPSSTNCPPALSVSSSLTWFYGSSVIHLSRRPFWGVRLFLVCLDVSFTKTYSGGYSSGAPPLPIPNREVKPGRADGTAPQCGRVGRRRFSLLPSSGTFCSSGGEVSFFVACENFPAGLPPFLSVFLQEDVSWRYLCGGGTCFVP